MALELAMQALTGLVILLVVGLVLTILADRLKLSNLFLLLVGGFLLSILHTKGFLHLEFTDVLLVSLALITLVVVVFDGSSKFTLKRVEIYSISALKIVLAFLLLSLFLLTPFISYFFFGSLQLHEILFAFIIAVTITGTDPTSVFRLMKNSSTKTAQILELESIFNTPFTVILPLIALQLIQTAEVGVLSDVILSQFSPLFLQITAGIGTGVLFGFFMAKAMRKFYSPELSPIILLSSALMAYLLAEQISGSGVLSVATMGLFFGNTIIRKKEDLQHFNELLGSIFVLLVFVLVGFLVSSSYTLSLIMKTLVLYVIAVFVRFQVITATIPSTKFTWKEKAFMTLVMPKGVAVAVVVFSLAVLNFGHLSPHLLDTTIQIIVLTMALSLLIATIVLRFSYYFLSTNDSQEETTQKDLPTIIKGTVHVKTKPQLRLLADKKQTSTQKITTTKSTKTISTQHAQLKTGSKKTSKQKTTKKK